MEICDVYDEAGVCTGRTVARGTTLAQGEYYLVVQVWIRSEAGEYLVQQRALHLKSSAGMWATTAGYVVAGEESLDGALREVMEELGITLSPTRLRRFERLKMNIQLEDVWIAEVSRDAITPTIGSEVSAWQWASKQKLKAMIHEGTFFGYSYFDKLP